jgi:hypothetical protein
MLTELYKYIYLQDLGYVVYRETFPAKCPVEEGARAHKTAAFVAEAEAKDYCRYRNCMTRLHGTDDVAKINLRSLLANKVTVATAQISAGGVEHTCIHIEVETCSARYTLRIWPNAWRAAQRLVNWQTLTRPHELERHWRGATAIRLEGCYAAVRKFVWDYVDSPSDSAWAALQQAVTSFNETDQAPADPPPVLG